MLALNKDETLKSGAFPPKTRQSEAFDANGLEGGGEFVRPLAIDLYCGLGGWTDGLLALGYRCIGYDIEEHAYGDQRYQGELVVQDVLTLHGSAFKDAARIVASPPCQEYSYMAMPWKLAKAKAAAIRADTTGALAGGIARQQGKREKRDEQRFLVAQKAAQYDPAVFPRKAVTQSRGDAGELSSVGGVYA